MTAANQGCSPCHSPGAVAALKSATQAEIEHEVLALTARLNAWGLANASADLDKAELNWEFRSYGGPTAQDQIPIQIKRARYNLHYVEEDRSLGVHNKKYAAYLLANANAQLDELGVGKARAADVSRNRSALKQQLDETRAAKATDNEWGEA